MELKLDDVRGLVSLVKQVDIYSFLLYFSLLLPFFYVILCKMLGLDDTAPGPDPEKDKNQTRSLLEIPVEAVTSILNFFTVKNAPGKRIIFGISMVCFLLGIVVLLQHGRTIARVQRNALQVRNFMAVHHYNECDLKAVLPSYDVSIQELLDVFPNDFVINHPYDYQNHKYYIPSLDDTVANDQIILIDSAQSLRSTDFAAKLLDSYLNRYAVIDSPILIDDLFAINTEFFTRNYTYELIARKPLKYALGANPQTYASTITLLKRDSLQIR
jgi:hypothetical protein